MAFPFFPFIGFHKEKKIVYSQAADSLLALSQKSLENNLPSFDFTG